MPSACFEAARQRSEQVFTLSQSRAHFLRQVKGLPQDRAGLGRKVGLLAHPRHVSPWCASWSGRRRRR